MNKLKIFFLITSTIIIILVIVNIPYIYKKNTFNNFVGKFKIYFLPDFKKLDQFSFVKIKLHQDKKVIEKYREKKDNFPIQDFEYIIELYTDKTKPLFIHGIDHLYASFIVEGNFDEDEDIELLLCDFQNIEDYTVLDLQNNEIIRKVLLPENKGYKYKITREYFSGTYFLDFFNNELLFSISIIIGSILIVISILLIIVRIIKRTKSP